MERPVRICSHLVESLEHRHAIRPILREQRFSGDDEIRDCEIPGELRPGLPRAGDREAVDHPDEAGPVDKVMAADAPIARRSERLPY